MRKKYRRLEESPIEEPLLNLTPLIDVVFVVLISFLIIAPLLNVDGVDLAESHPKEKKDLQTSSIAISVHEDNSIWYRGAKVDLPTLQTHLRKEKKRFPQAIPQLFHDKKAAFGTYQSIKDLLESMGFEQMDVILKPS